MGENDELKQLHEARQRFNETEKNHDEFCSWAERELRGSPPPAVAAQIGPAQRQLAQRHREAAGEVYAAEERMFVASRR